MKNQIVWTLSKIGAFCILFCGTGYAFYDKDSSVIILAMTICGGLLGWKGYNERKTKENEQNSN